MSNPTARIVDVLSSARSRSGNGASAPEETRLSETERAEIEQTVKRAVTETLEERELESRASTEGSDAAESSSGRSKTRLVAGGLALASVAYLTKRWRGRSDRGQHFDGSESLSDGGDGGLDSTESSHDDASEEHRTRNADGTFASGPVDDG